LTFNLKNGSKFNPHLVLPKNDDNLILKVIKNEIIVGYVQQLLGNDLTMWNCHLYTKQPESVNQVEWHQDSYYFPLYPKKSVTVWIALDNVDHNNGAMYYIPEKLNADVAHVADSSKLSFKYYIDSLSIDSRNQVLNKRSQGQFSIHDFYTVHRSNVNQSCLPRSALIIRYMPSDVHYDHDEHQARLYKEFDQYNDGTMDKNVCVLNTGGIIVSGKNLNEKNLLWK